MRKPHHLWTAPRTLLLLLLALTLSVACANTGEDEEPAPAATQPVGGGQPPLFETTPPAQPLDPGQRACCRICLASQACGDVCIDPRVVRCPTPPPAGCACQG
jgi:hypothetical protein